MNSTVRTFPPIKKVRAVEFTTCAIAGQVVLEVSQLGAPAPAREGRSCSALQGKIDDD
ncbi:MAG: hypothetical protein M3Y48_03675 [Actinomycetota bacterium]|nr:hypothetical protein [Actinomycetota bacterium]